MGGACPSRAPPTPSVEGSRAPPPPLLGGWYRDGRNWVHMDVNVVITDGVGGGLRGSGTMPAADIMVVHFDHLPHRDVQGHIQPNGDIKWANGKAWLKYEGEWQSPGSASESLSPGLASESLSRDPASEAPPQTLTTDDNNTDNQTRTTTSGVPLDLPRAESYKKYDTTPWEGRSLHLDLDQAQALAAMGLPDDGSNLSESFLDARRGALWLHRQPRHTPQPGSASESMSPKLVNESLIVAAPAELAPQEPQANLAAWDDDVVDTLHARACEALKAVKIGQVRPEADGSAVAAHSGSSESPGSASESLSPGSASESLVVAAPTELAPPGPHANPAAPAQDARYFLRNADGSMMTEEEAAPMAATMAAQDLAQERDRLQRAQEIERLVMEARGLRPPG